MSKKNPFLTGTLILTIAGFLSRFIGFFYRAFLSQTFGEEGMGIYQLLAPVMALSYSLTAAGIQTAVSKYTASETTTHDSKSSLHVLHCAFLISMPLSAFCTWVIFQYSDWIAIHFLLESRCAPLLRIFALSIPFCATHSLINGYFYGIKQASVPALTQILEQLARVGSVYLISGYAISHGKAPHIGYAVVGLAVGECTSTLISLTAAFLRFHHLQSTIPAIRTASEPMTKKILVLATPLTLSRLAVNFLQSIEAVSIPNCLVQYGFSQSQALSVYGVLTGMALPLVLFPSALVNSACVLLLPVISEADETGRHHTIHRVVKKAVFYCTLFGSLCTAGFLLFGNFAGMLLFKSNMAGSFILTLSFICPLLYLSGALSSILHGLGKTAITFFFNVTALVIRLLFVFLLIPSIGIQGYLYGLLFSQLLITVFHLLAVKYHISKRN